MDLPFTENLAALMKLRSVGRPALAQSADVTPKRLREILGGDDLSGSELFALARALGVTVDVLSALPRAPAIVDQDAETRLGLAKSFIEGTILFHYRQLVTWQTVTNQSSQIDSGYLGQHLVSLLTGLPGRGAGSRGKGVDLEGGGEIKVASTLGGVDKPRWNNPMGKSEQVKKYLANRTIHFVLIDTVERGLPFPVRLRVWRVRPARDPAFRAVVEKWSKRKTSGNFQLHPPCWDPTDVATNDCGNLKLPLYYSALQRELGDVDYIDTVSFNENAGSSRVQPKAK
jgi:hypothetical protein